MMNKLKTIQLYNFDLLIKVISWAGGSFKRGDFIWYKIIWPLLLIKLYNSK